MNEKAVKAGRLFDELPPEAQQQVLDFFEGAEQFGVNVLRPKEFLNQIGVKP
jgi:hypothetical protein